VARASTAAGPSQQRHGRGELRQPPGPAPQPPSPQSPPWENAALCSADPNCAGIKAYKAQFMSLIKPQSCWQNISPYWNQNDGM
jgi:hypothetical protein